jgi:dTDP-4-amino-4,6-dideoxygalactose transaminase
LETQAKSSDMSDKKIYLSSPHMGGTEISYVQEAFATNWIAPFGKNVDGFEQDLAEYTSRQAAAALSSGTAAIHLALIQAGIKAGDEVICQSFTFCGSSNPILYQGAIPVLVDSENETWNMDPQLLEDAIKDRISKGKKPKGIIYVHLYGMPAKYNEINNVAKRFEIPLIEDAAEALGSTYKGFKCGNLGDASILSFNGNKIITTSGGGALLSNDQGYIAKTRFLATQARDDAPHYEHSELGYNYRMSNICAGIGRGQMEVLDQWVDKRRSIHSFYENLLQGIDGITFVKEPDGYFANRWLTTITVNPDKTGGISYEDIRLALEKENIESRPLWKPMHLQPLYKDVPFYGNGTCEKLFQTGLCLPSGSNMTEEDFDRIKQVLLSLFPHLP